MTPRSVPGLAGNDPLKLLHKLNGYYECPKAGNGMRLGPLVGYAGTYEPGKNYVGDVYANFAKAEEHPDIINRWAVELLGFEPRDILQKKTDVFCGAPEGGKTLADKLALHTARRYIYPEKKVIAAATADAREKSQLIFSRHSVCSGETVAIVEDVANNFSTTEQLIELIKDSGGVVVAIISLLNRSPKVDDVYRSTSGQLLPVISLVRRPFPEYRQDDPAVADDIACGNVVWKPKDEWPRLMAAMATANQLAE